jgi:hypothetical protein
MGFAIAAAADCQPEWTLFVTIICQSGVSSCHSDLSGYRYRFASA